MGVSHSSDLNFRVGRNSLFDCQYSVFYGQNLPRIDHPFTLKLSTTWIFLKKNYSI